MDEFMHDLQDALSRTRLETYRSEDDPTSDLDMITNYFWDLDLAEALVPSLHAVELAVRNSMHRVLSRKMGTEMWFYVPGLLRSTQLEMLASGLEKLARKRHDATADRIVSALPMGFWVSMLTGPYEQPLWRPDGYRLLFEVFPHAGSVTRKQIHTRLDGIRDLRNRVFHHQHIWDRSDLPHEHHQIHEVVNWISPTLALAVQAVDDFPAIYAGRTGVRERLKANLDLK
ncbi:MAG: hypothetical protein QM692_18240 [Thermomicrobiales bacterium]